jgi:hypothetical protein
LLAALWLHLPRSPAISKPFGVDVALWPNNRRDILGQFPVGISGYLAFQEVDQRPQKRLAYFAGPNIAATSSVPEGGFQSAVSILPPLVAGGIAAASNATDISFSQTGSALAGGPVEGGGTITVTQDGGLSLQVTLAGDGSIAVTQDGALALTIGLAADGAFALTGAGGLSMIVPAEGVASFALSGAANLKGNLSLSGDIVPFTELSPESLANAVWNSLLEGSYTAKGLLRLIAAVNAGKTDITDLGGGSATVTFRDLNDTKTRVTASMTGSERTTVTKDAS